MTIRISDDLKLPPAVVTEKLAFLGRTGSGKTYAAQKLAEEMHAAGAQFVVLDPVGVWFGLRLAADGKRPGLPIPVLGGLRGDIPLEPTAGALIANLVVDRGTSVVLDVSQFESDADKARFAQAFADRFYFRKKASPSAVHVFIEEAQEFAPQNPQRDDARMLHAFTRLVKIGRNFGIGVSLITQRPQEVNKKVLNLTELLFAFQLTGPQERKTIEGWIAEKGIDEDIAGELPKLTVGHPHVWSPAWLKISKVVAIGAKATFDASSTPVVGKAAAARELSPIDLQQLRTEMAATIEKAKAEDPKALRAEIADLKRRLESMHQAHDRLQNAKAPGKAKTVEIQIVKPATVKALERAIDRADAAVARVNGVLAHLREIDERMFAPRFTAMQEVSAQLQGVAAAVVAQLRALRVGQGTPGPISPRMELVRAQQRGSSPAKILAHPTAVMVSRTAGPPAEGLDASQQRILDTVAMLNARGLEASRDRVARWQDLHPTGGRYGQNLGYLRAEGYLDGFVLTDKGQRAARALPTGLEAGLEALTDEGKRDIIRALLAAGKPLSRDELAAVLELHPTGGRFGQNLGWLRTMGVIPERGPIIVTEGMLT